MNQVWNETTLLAARDEHEEWLYQQPSVTGMGIGYDHQGQLCLKVLTDQADAVVRSNIEAHLRGIPVCFEETGPIEAQ